VMVWVPAWISMVRWRRAVRTNFLIDQPVRPKLAHLVRTVELVVASRALRRYQPMASRSASLPLGG
jgi:hypothetical protein